MPDIIPEEPGEIETIISEKVSGNSFSKTLGELLTTIF